jgi:acetolactate synthase-1/2/3 large subunit
VANVAQAVAQTLAAYGTERYFCLTGGDHDLWLALHDSGIPIVNCRSEAGATYMADGYARVSGRPGFVYGQRGPGVANVAAALADAYWALSPVVSLTTSIANPTRGRYQYQDVDTLPMHAPVTIWNQSLAHPTRAADMVRAAIRAATGPVPGPVHLEIPADMLVQDAGDGAPYADAHGGRVGALRPLPAAGQAAALLDTLLSAERPVMLAGHGTILSQAWEELAAVAQALSIPVATTLGGKGSIDESSRLAVGVVGRYSRRVANQTLADADLVLVLGSRLGGLATNAWSIPRPGTRIVQVDTDPVAIGMNFPPELGIVADVRACLQALRAEIQARGARPATTDWADRVAGEVRAWRVHAQDLAGVDPGDGIHPARVIEDLRARVAPNDQLVVDTGAVGAWAGTLFPVAAGNPLVRSAGSLGWAFPGSLGAAMADPSRRTVCLVGDGGLLYHLGELETAVRQQVPIMVVVLNNRAFASEHHLLINKWGRELPEVTDFHDVDLVAIAEGFGVRGLTVSEPGDVGEALATAYREDGPVLVDCRVSKAAEAPGEVFRGDSPV